MCVSFVTFVFSFHSCHASACLSIHAFVHFLFILAMYATCLSMPCTFPVYPYHNLYYTAEKQQNFIIHSCHACCLFIHPCLCTFPVYPCNASFLLAIHVMAVYPSNPLHISYIYHVSRLSTMQHTKKSFRHSWLFPFSVEWLAVK